MKKAIIIAAAFLVLFSCTNNETPSLVGQWKMTAELLDIGDGKGFFKKVDSQQTIDFFENGTFSSTVNFCLTPSGDGGNGTYFIAENKLVPICGQDDRVLFFELSGQELIINLSCIEPCKQKYQKVN